MRRLALIALPLALSGCFYPADRGRALETRIEKLDASQAQLQEELKQTRAQLDATLPRIDEKISEVSKALRSLDTASRRTGADIGIQLQKTVEDLAQLRGQVETYLHKIGELETALAQTNEATEKRLLALKGEEALREAEARKKAEELKRPTDKKEFLALAQEKAKGGDVAVARQLYSEFLKKWPKDALAAEAHFGLGETYFAEDKCREALFEYGKLLQEYPKADATPSAYLRSSDCFKKLKMQEESRLALEELVKGYPKSDAAKTAKARLAELDKAKKAEPKKGKK
ncbi:tetratricopeptide repeat protein [Archangium violaceum]|uniref:tetratricopeptide repeat protein n=1 Tax=Archangium violaceum TaxID=83451 RepID=UPI00193B255C|nr:tetratricopeptide repeat protein [Archangium violaceum]QRK08049.1 tetratricopeptide repeat protein [Archangium violaceum]